MAALGNPSVLTSVVFAIGVSYHRKWGRTLSFILYTILIFLQVMHRRPGKAHLNGPKSSARKARLSIAVAVGTSQLSLVRACLPYARL